MNDRLSEDELRTLLGRAADEHRPDRTAMLNRIALQRADVPGAARRPRQAARMAGAALAVVAVLGVGGVARWALAGDGDRDATPAASAPASPPVSLPVSPSAPAPSTAAPSVKPPTKRPVSTTTPPPRSTPAGTTRVEQGSLWSDGSVRTSGDAAADSEITLKLGEPVTALTVTVRVRRTPGFSDRGAVHDVTTARVDSQIIQETDALTYRFTLAPGATLGKGTHVFTARYGHEAGGRNAGDDAYRATATTADGEKLTVYGDFF
ncbi:hypothetical protein AB0M36_23280 [Actinoplanes sp. NPDC051346]|uniref:hypothetical protein n=1 Tax=Actinoplanes sp. NPDC051346 TaxID=3155048 RepID=UPI00343C466E